MGGGSALSDDDDGATGTGEGGFSFTNPEGGGDGILDSTGLFDNLTFEVDENPTATQSVPTPR